MAVVENRFVCDLSKPVQAQALKGNVFSLDNLGSRISVLIYDNGQPATISGSVTANCILPDGSTVNVNGGLTTENGGSKAYVDVPQSCLLIPGILKIAIKCTSSSVITTLAAIVANVYMTKTDNVITPSQQIINDWNAEISAAIATQNAAIANQDTKINDLKSAFNSFSDDFYPVNLFNPSATVDGKLVSRVDGSISDYSTDCYCKVYTNGAKYVRAKNFPYSAVSSQLGACYASDGTFKQGLYLASEQGEVSLYTAGIDYLLINCTTAKKNEMMVFLDEAIPSESIYLPYNTRINKNFVDDTLSVKDKAADAKKTGDVTNNIKSIISPVINPENILNDPQISSVKSAPGSYVEDDGWYYISGYESSVVRKDAFANALYFIRESAGNCYIVQDINKSKLSAGTYIVRFSAKAGNSNNAIIGITGYPNVQNSGGTSLGSVTISIFESNYYQEYYAELTITDPSSYNHCRFSIQFYSQDDLYVSDLLLVKNDKKGFFSLINSLTDGKLLHNSLVIDGDSILYGEGSAGGFGKLIAEKYDMSFVNNAISGATIATGTYWSNSSPRHWICTSIENINPDLYKYIFVGGGINDMGNNVPLGEITSEYIYQASQVDTTTFAGAMEYLCWKLVTQFAANKKGFILPHKITRSDYYPNTNGNTFSQYREVAKNVCHKYGVPILDIGDVGGLNTYYADNKTKFTLNGDGVHPTLLGYKLFYVPQITEWMKAM